jgi:glycosyltransferase involved in cell wall biosynthesis
MPVHNGERWIGEAINSLYQQTLDDWDLTVVDDGSTDRSAQIVNAFHDERIRLLRQANRGQSAAQNRGISESSGAYVMLLDADDRLRPCALECLHGAISRETNASLAYGRGTYIREDGVKMTPDRRVELSRKPSGDVLTKILKRNFIGYPGCALIRRQALMEAGPLKTQLVLAQDWELWCRLATVGSFVFAGSQVVLDYRVHKSSVSRTTGSNAKNQRQAIEAVYANPMIRSKVPARLLARLRQARLADANAFAAVELLRAGRIGEARRTIRRAFKADCLTPRIVALCLALHLPKLPVFVLNRIGV